MTTERPAIPPGLASQRVAITGRLACMSRRDAVALIERFGGQFAVTVNRETTMLVVGREGWPLCADGRLSRKLQRARSLRQRGQSLDVISEEGFLRQLQLPHLASEVCQSYTLMELTRLLNVSRRQIESWQRNGLLSSTGDHHQIPCFDFRQVAAAKSLLRLLKAGVPPRRLHHSLWQLHTWFSCVDGTADIVGRLLHDGPRLILRTDDGRLTETNGQLLLEFEIDEESPVVAWREAPNGDRLFEEAVRMEQEGQLEEAAKRYRQVLLNDGPDADVCFNLANVLHALGESRAAIERYHEAVTIDRDHVDAWNNLGNLFAEIGQLEESRQAYQRAVSLEPDYADARYGLADVLEQLGRLDEARHHWRAYLQQEQSGPHSDYARQQLATQPA